MCKIALAGVQIITALLPLTIICIMRLLEFGACSFVYNQLWIVRQCPPFLPPEMAQQGGHFANPISLESSAWFAASTPCTTQHDLSCVLKSNSFLVLLSAC
eukprot:scaffold157926_cov19-Tisochrysis_lutea.AAC.3